jgi:hypothetical protein
VGIVGTDENVMQDDRNIEFAATRQNEQSVAGLKPYQDESGRWLVPCVCTNRRTKQRVTFGKEPGAERHLRTVAVHTENDPCLYGCGHVAESSRSDAMQRHLRRGYCFKFRKEITLAELRGRRKSGAKKHRRQV